MPRVLLITALQEEFDAVFALLPGGRVDWTEKQLPEGHVFYEAGFSDEVGNPFSIQATCQIQQGPKYAMAHATRMLHLLRPDFVVMTGICAGNPNPKKKIALGDVILANMAFDYETGKYVGDVFKPEMELTNVDPVTLQRLNDFCSIKKGLLNISGDEYKLHIGAFATGSSVMSKATIFSELEARERDVLALEMEAFSVLKAVELSNLKIPAAVFKGVCDYADPDKEDSAHALASQTAAFCALEAVSYLIPRVVAPSKPVVPEFVEYLVRLPRPALTYRHRELWHSLLQWPDAESWGFANGHNPDDEGPDNRPSGLTFYPVGSDKWLLEVIVGYGAYNGTFRYYYLDESVSNNSWSSVQFRCLEWSENEEICEWMGEELVGNAWFDPDTNKIRTFYKGRGIGDYGSLITYDFQEGNTTLIEYRHRDWADNDDELNFEEIPPPEAWPVIDISVVYPPYYG